MYEEHNPNFAFKNIILKILLVILVVFLIIWLFPTKNYVANLIDKKLGTGGDQVFNNNIKAMKEGALAYYNGDRLPKENKEKAKMTLEDMLDKNLLIEFKDSNGKKCDSKKSYVQVTKNSEDYTLKVNLVCSDNEAYVVSYFGTYDYCTDGVCEKKKLAEETAVTSSEEASESNNVAQASECQYVKNTKGYWTSYGNWSAWTANKVTASDTRQVETKTEKVQSGTTKVLTNTVTMSKNPRKILVTQNGVQKTLYICPSDYDNGGAYERPIKCVKTVNTYKDEPVYKTVTYYRYRDRSYVGGTAKL